MQTGLVAMAEMLPYVVAKAAGGPLIDRLGARSMAIACDLGCVLVVGLVPLLHGLGLLSVPVLLPIVFLLGVLRGPSDAAKQSLVPQVAVAAGLPLERVTGVVGAIERLASTAGAAGAGALIGWIGAVEALWVNAATFGFAALVLLVGLARGAKAEGHPQRRSYRQDFAEGWRFLRSDAVLMGIVIMVAATNLLDQAYATVLLPVWTQQSGHGPALLGMMFAAFAGASMLGAIIAAMIGEKLPRLLVYTVAFLLTGFPRFVVFAVEAPLWGIFAVLVTAGFASGFLNPILSAVMFERIPAALVGRVTSIYGALCWALIPFGGLVGGALIGLVGLAPAFVLMGLAYLAATLLPLMRRSFRGFARPVLP